MFVKYCNSKFHIIKEKQEFERMKKMASNLIDVDVDKYLYIVNESVHSNEHYGPNANGDAFPLNEMEEHYHTFINSRVSVDHKDELNVGKILDSVFVAPKISGRGQFTGGSYIENILGVDKEKVADLQDKNLLKIDLIDDILKGNITDTSMGAIVGYTECSIPSCKNIAYKEDQYCEHIRGGKNRSIKLADGSDHKVFEVCHDVRWFEDSIIVPLYRGGLAGGEGADEAAKILNIVTQSTDWETRLFDLYEQIKKVGSRTNVETFEIILKHIAERM